MTRNKKPKGDQSNSISSNNNNIDQPLRFIDVLASPKHIVLFYEELEYGRRVIFRFIKNGLLKGEHCLYAVADNFDFIEQKMRDSGIETQFKKKNLLRLYSMPNPIHDK